MKFETDELGVAVISSIVTALICVYTCSGIYCQGCKDGKESVKEWVDMKRAAYEKLNDREREALGVQLSD